MKNFSALCDGDAAPGVDHADLHAVAIAGGDDANVRQFVSDFRDARVESILRKRVKHMLYAQTVDRYRRKIRRNVDEQADAGFRSKEVERGCQFVDDLPDRARAFGESLALKESAHAPDSLGRIERFLADELKDLSRALQRRIGSRQQAFTRLCECRDRPSG